MAILFWEGGEGYQSADLSQKISAVGLDVSGNLASIALARSNAKGTRSIGTVASNVDETFYITVNDSTIYVEFWMYTAINDNGNSVTFFELQDSTDSGTFHLRMRIHPFSSGHIAKFYDSSNTLVGSVTMYPSSTWTHIGIKLVVGNSGTLTVRLDDVVQLNAITGDFQSGSITTVNRVFFRLTSFLFIQFRLDDLVIQDSGGSFLGSNVHSVASFPTGAGDSTQWTPSTGANYTCVDETDPNDDTDYVSSSTLGQLDLYAITDLPSFTGSVLGVDIWARLRKDTGGVETCKLALKTNSTVYYGSTVSPGNSYAVSRHLALVNPNTSVSWTQANVNALQIGAEIT
jgi:hypothetical protein